MNDAQGHSVDEGLASLAIDPDLLARELEAELDGDPLDEIDVEGFEFNVIKGSLKKLKEVPFILMENQFGNQ